MNPELLQHLRTRLESDVDLPPSARARLLALVTQAEPENTSTTWPAALAELEAAHPEVTAFLNRTAVVLGNMGL
ncbi:DUF4404 family protein [Prosthecobacter sp.]|uniref:DUF4404 family protein n=1 Tax=Prosthecobacter sp. TaxID=1965333 RepID=UPI002AB90D21|nr:DUF4404 family protein [Prosthecobacter sp.]MDZ4404694.1 DUF4404 family protein [Prosthecobacter sp.]